MQRGMVEPATSYQASSSCGPPTQGSHDSAEETQCADDSGSARCFKTELNTYCQRIVRRSLSKSDIMYTMVSFGPYHQALVKIRCLGDITIAGDLFDNHWQAVQSAARHALEYHAEAHGPSAPPTADAAPAAVRGRSGDDPPPKVEKRETPAANPSLTPKVVLNTLCTRVARRYLLKGDTVYTTTQVDTGFQATVRLNALPGRWQLMVWTGKVCSAKRDAEQSAAEAALAALSSSDDITALVQRR